MDDFVISDGNLTEYRGPGGVVRVPEGVIRIDSMVFRGQKTVAEVILPEGLTEIGFAAFNGCENLRRITLPDTLRVLGDYVFGGCTSLAELCHPNVKDGIFYDAAFTRVILCPQGKTGHVRLPETVTDIQSRAFFGCRGLTGITLPSGLQRIGAHAFYACTGLKELELPEGVGISWRGILGECTALEKLVLQPGVEGFHMRYLRDTRVRCIINHSGSPLLSRKEKDDGYVSRVDAGYMPGENLAAACSVYKIAAAACYLSSRERYSSDEQMIYDAYISRQAGKLLRSFVEGDCLQSIRRLLETGKVKPKALQKAIEAAGEKPEAAAMLLQWQNAHVDLAAEQEREEKKQLRALFHEETPLQRLRRLFNIKRLADGSYAISSYVGEEAVVEVPGEIGGIPVTVIGNRCFSPLKRTKNRNFKGQNLQKVLLPDTVKLVEEEAFAECGGLTEIRLPEGLATLESGAFRACSRLKQIALPSSLRYLGNGVFEFCRSLEKITLPEGITKLPNRLFYGCDTLKQVELPDSVTKMGTAVFFGCDALTEPPLSMGMRSIPKRAFAGMQGLRTITVPGRIRTVGDRAFAGCENLREVTFCEGVKALTGEIFGGCENLQEVTLPQSLTFIGEDVFENSVWVPEMVTLRVRRGSCAERFAAENYFIREIIGEEPK